LLAAVLGVGAAAILVPENQPASDASGMQVIAFYQAHRTGTQVSTILLTLAVAFLVLFAGSLAAHLRRTVAAEALSLVILAGAVLEAAGQTVVGGVSYALADAPSHLDPAAAQALNLLASDLVLTNTIGLFVFGIGSGLAILRGDRLPGWLGWPAIAFAIVAITPAEALAFIALVVWMAVVSILLTVDRRDAAAGSAATAG
jgi:hypothetical protein